MLHKVTVTWLPILNSELQAHGSDSDQDVEATSQDEIPLHQVADIIAFRQNQIDALAAEIANEIKNPMELLRGQKTPCNIMKVCTELNGLKIDEIILTMHKNHQEGDHKYCLIFDKKLL